MKLTQLFSNLYNETESPVKLLTAYLSLFGTGKYQNFINSDYDPRHAKVAPINSIVSIFGNHSVLIWTAMLLKKRIVVYSDNIIELMNLIRAFPCFVWFRQNWDLLRPLTQFDNEIDTEDLKKAVVYVAGTIDPHIKSDSKWFDLLVDLSSQTVQVAEHAQEDFRVNRLHKEVAKIITSETDNNKLIKALALKTNEIVSVLKNLAKGSNKVIIFKKFIILD